jgi:hypothetical protein
MDTKCFVIMPSGESTGYAQGHFNRVYDYVIVPACRAAGVWPNRIDNLGSNDPMESIRNIVDSDIAIFDLSTNNPNALYGLAIREALKLPSTLIKDQKTYIGFGSEFTIVEYDESLRIDTVQNEIENLSSAIKSAIENKGSKHDLLTQLGVGVRAAPIQPPSDDTSSEESEEEAPEPKAPPLPIISPLPDYVGEPLDETDIEKIKVGAFIFHMNHGKGEIKTLKKISKDKIASIEFESGAKILVLGTSGFFRKIND